jgi:hypothetical protein
MVRKFSVVAKDDSKAYKVMFVVQGPSGGVTYAVERDGKLQTLRDEHIAGVHVDEDAQDIGDTVREIVTGPGSVFPKPAQFDFVRRVEARLRRQLEAALPGQRPALFNQLVRILRLKLQVCPH